MVTKVSGLEGVDKVKDGSIEFADLSAACVSGIVSSGSNANGNWTKFADGTMICTHALLGPISMGLYITGLYQGVVTWTFPSQFVGSPSVSGTGVDQSSVGWVSGSSITHTSAGIVYYSKSSAVSGSLLPVTAIGRWK